MQSIHTPVVFIIFNRPDLTEKVFQQITRVKPQKLFIIADGARFTEEQEKCDRARKIVQQVDWNCKVITNFSDVNLGCRKRVSSGLDWVFSQVEEAIILEDDCLPTESFFYFCQELLDKYRDDKRIMHISGNNFRISGSNHLDSYYFSRLIFCWGWATWRRAWNYYDVEMNLWNEVKEKKLFMDLMTCQEELNVRYKVWEEVYKGNINTWDYQWQFSVLCQGGLSVTPNQNLISNIGFGENATHTKSQNSWLSNLPRFDLQFPLIHPKLMIRDIKADKIYFNKVYKSNKKTNTLKWFVKNVIQRIIKLFYINNMIITIYNFKF